MKDNLINSISDLLKLYLDNGTVDKILLETINEDVLKKLNYYTPEMYGAVGDGIQDDTSAILAMIADIEKNIPQREFTDELPCKDYSYITMKFTGNYRISAPIVFDTTYGLTLDNLKLTASDRFTGDGMLIFNNITRNCKVNNITINGLYNIDDDTFNADTCILINGYTLTFDITNAEITHFRNYGIYADGKGHELKLSNVRVNQYEWGEWQYISPIGEALGVGTGVYLGSDRHDNNFTNVIVNYCEKYGVELLGGTTNIVNSHFYSCRIWNEGKYNTFSACYFDNAPFKTFGFFTLTDSLFLKSEGDTTPFIYLLVDSVENSWIYDTCIMTGNNFKAVDFVENAIDIGVLTEAPKFNASSNAFYHVRPFFYFARLGHSQNPWDYPREYYGDDTEGYIISGDLVYMWGHITGNGFVTYPNGMELSHTLHIGFERQDNANPNLIPWANTIKPNQFWANSVGDTSTVKWFVIGLLSSMPK